MAQLQCPDSGLGTANLVLDRFQVAHARHSTREPRSFLLFPFKHYFFRRFNDLMKTKGRKKRLALEQIERKPFSSFAFKVH